MLNVSNCKVSSSDVKRPENVAYNRSASQSGVYVDTSDCVRDAPDVQRFCGAHGAQLAVDGSDDTDYWHGSCAVTDTSNQSAWWRLDLGATYNISSLQIYQANQVPLPPRYIEVFVDGQECYNVTGSDISSTIIHVTCHQTLSGSTLTLRTSSVDTAPSLTLCEVKIFQCSDFWFGSQCQYRCHCKDKLEVCDKHSGACASQCAEAWTGTGCQDHNIALNQSAHQEGTWSDAGNCTATSTTYCGPRPASLAVDGSTDQNFQHGSCSQTALGRPVTSWDLSLGSLHQIYRMKIYFPQKDGFSTAGLQVTVNGAVCYVSNTSLPTIADITCRQPLNGVFVSINLPPFPTSPGVTSSPGARVLALCEVLIYECDDFWFGSNCSQLCRCQNTSEVCDKMTGECPRTGCSAGWMGTGCQTVCPSSTFGLNCSSNCGKCADNSVCDHVTGACPGSCAAGFAGEGCSECLTGMYGVNCDQSCPGCPGNGSCNRNNGTCSTPCPAHYTGARCDRCHDDWYGSSCQLPCGECRNDGPCNTTTGLCPDGCDPGWQGALCKQECPDGRYGMDCSEVCGHCVDPAPCDKLTGFCLDECALGWSGDLCDKQQPTTRSHQQPTPPSSTTVTFTHTAATTKTPATTLSTSSPATSLHSTRAREPDKTSQGHPPTSHRPTQHKTDRHPTQGPTSHRPTQHKTDRYPTQGPTSHGHSRTGKSDHQSKNQLSEGAVAAIVVSCVLALCIVLHSFIFIRYSRRRPCHWLRGRRKHTYGRDRIESPEDFDFTSGTELPKYGPALFPDTKEKSGTGGISNPNYIPDTVSPDV
ncbi:multiple epidermal growth factor-like domains protein 11 [Haliotis rubra]|uniref:multiple epidermal growth factor-like domains protein 11 n=1 Tax=Haliotis rubra TaxID=36100 RepID=UPI001EE527FF|nr:multiple epidermal growth factor-like domains protein 11 [Haliotis rubra]